MTSPNPYAPPAAEVREALSDIPVGVERLIPGGRSVPAGNGFAWYGQAWRLFKAQPFMWWIAMLVVFGVVFVTMMIPFVNLVAILGFPLISAGIASCAHSTLTDGRFEIAQVFDGFRRNSGQLLLIGAIYLGLMIGTVAVLALVFGASSLFGFLFGGHSTASGLALMSLGAGIVVVYVVALMAIGTSIIFAPYLVFEHDIKAVDAMKMSVTGSFRNILPAIVAGIAYLVLAILATIPVGLGWLVLFPVLMLAVYAAYRDIYVESALVA